jgi:hypothetical protein
MAHSRRTVLKAAALAGTALFVPSDVLEAFQRQAAPEPLPLGADNRPLGRSRARLTRSNLRNHVGSDFIAQTPGGTEVTLRLVEVEDVPNASAAGQEGSEGTFAARFTDSSGILLSQGTYTLDHDGLGRVWWFLVPVDMPAGRLQTYEAIFNNAVQRTSPPRRRPTTPPAPRRSGASSPR